MSLIFASHANRNLCSRKAGSWESPARAHSQRWICSPQPDLLHLTW